MAAVTVYSAPEDGRKGRPKYVEHIVVVNKHNTARVASCWFIIYYRLVMHGNSNIKFVTFLLLVTENDDITVSSNGLMLTRQFRVSLSTIQTPK